MLMKVTDFTLYMQKCLNDYCPLQQPFSLTLSFYLQYSWFQSQIKIFVLYNMIKVIRHVFGFGIEFLENKDIDIFGYFMVIYFITRYSSHTYFSPFSTSWYCRFGAGCIVRNGEWHIIVNYSVFSALFSLKRRILFEEGILDTLAQKDAVPPMVISNYHRWKPNSTKTELCIELSLFTSHWSTVWNIAQVVSIQYQRQTSIKLFNQIDFVFTLSFKV